MMKKKDSKSSIGSSQEMDPDGMFQNPVKDGNVTSRLTLKQSVGITGGHNLRCGHRRHRHCH